MADPICRTRILKNPYMKINIWWFGKSLITYIVITIVELKVADPMAMNSKCTWNDDLDIDFHVWIFQNSCLPYWIYHF